MGMLREGKAKRKNPRRPTPQKRHTHKMIPLRRAHFLPPPCWKNGFFTSRAPNGGFPRGMTTSQGGKISRVGLVGPPPREGQPRGMLPALQKKPLCTSSTKCRYAHPYLFAPLGVVPNIIRCDPHRGGEHHTDISKPLCMFKRFKMVKTSSYRRKSRSSPNGQGQKAKIGIKRLSAEYVKTGQLLVKQRKIIAFNFEKKTRRRNFKYYPGEHVKVTKNTSLVALTNGRVKYTFHCLQNVLIVNVLPEELDELREEDLYRYRTEHVKSFEENRSLVYLRMKHVVSFPPSKRTQFRRPPLRPQFLAKYDVDDNPTLRAVPVLYHKRE
ncbi:mitochondrial ribosomal protein L27 precursor, putative [Plasmodium vivax]|nr:unnamed protein product [Plasmodium vivax]CAI7720142.1 ribosomal protein L27, mitochondrial, putative [Plasmodium vivax]SCO66961.1 mitochondrial ribosomal protein L27 precursor, putative [Plasmodium vivax]SCO72389.1 mitochondrial ribosomal protein L27 precursor, putative [Plasmodium vivax]